MGGFCGHPVGGEVIVTNPDRTRNASGGIPSLRSLFFHVLPLERLGLGQGSLRVLHLLELLGDRLDSAVQEIADCRAHGLRAAREVVDLHEEVECPQVARGQAQRDLFRVRIPYLVRPTAYAKPTPFDRRVSGGTPPRYITLAGPFHGKRPRFVWSSRPRHSSIRRKAQRFIARKRAPCPSGTAGPRPCPQPSCGRRPDASPIRSTRSSHRCRCTGRRGGRTSSPRGRRPSGPPSPAAAGCGRRRHRGGLLPCRRGPSRAP